MSSNAVFRRAFETVQNRFTLAIDGATPEQLAFRPHAEANSIAWLGWHLTRWQDAQVSRFAETDQLWVSGWAEKLGRPSDPADTGIGHTSQQVASLQVAADLLLEYHRAVCGASVAYLNRATEQDLQKVTEGPRGADTVEGRLIGVLSDNFQHVGQMAYLRGLLAGAHWGAH